MQYSKSYVKKAIELSEKVGSKTVAKQLCIPHTLLEEWIKKDKTEVFAENDSFRNEIRYITDSIDFLTSIVGFQ